MPKSVIILIINVLISQYSTSYQSLDYLDQVYCKIFLEQTELLRMNTISFLDDWIFMWLPEKSDQWSKKIMSSLKNVNDAKNVINKFLSVRLQLCKIIPSSWCTFSDTLEYLNKLKIT